MKYLFLAILMVGVGIGIVGCEDDDKDPPPQEEEVTDPQPHRAPEKWEPDISGLWTISGVEEFTNGTFDAWDSSMRIQQFEENIMGEEVEFDSLPPLPTFVPNGNVTKEYTIKLGDLSGVISEDANRMWGTNVSRWGATVWSGDKLP